jgi:hypothetical protein
MLRFISLAIFLFVNTSQDQFFKEVLSSKNKYKYYLVLDIKYNQKNEKMWILNYDFYEYMKLSNPKYGEYDNYVKDMLIVLQENKRLIIDSSKLIKGTFAFCGKSKEVEKNARKGREFFLNYYFYRSSGSSYLKDDVKGRDIGPILNILFKWHIFIGKNHGSLYIKNPVP